MSPKTEGRYTSLGRYEGPNYDKARWIKRLIITGLAMTIFACFFLTIKSVAELEKSSNFLSATRTIPLIQYDTLVPLMTETPTPTRISEIIYQAPAQ